MKAVEYVKTNKTFLTISALTIAFLVSLHYNLNPKVIFSPVPTKTMVVAPSATLTPASASIAISAGTSASLSNPNNTCHVTLADPTDPYSVLPDPNCTPGAVLSTVTQDTISTTICKTGWTTTARDIYPESYYENLKKIGIKDYGFTNTELSQYEEDHFIPIELGGSNDSSNLWPQYDGGKIPNKKDLVENYLKKEVCKGNITLADARTKIAASWYDIYLTLPKDP